MAILDLDDIKLISGRLRFEKVVATPKIINAEKNIEYTGGDLSPIIVTVVESQRLETSTGKIAISKLIFKFTSLKLEIYL